MWMHNFPRLWVASSKWRPSSSLSAALSGALLRPWMRKAVRAKPSPKVLRSPPWIWCRRLRPGFAIRQETKSKELDSGCLAKRSCPGCQPYAWSIWRMRLVKPWLAMKGSFSMVPIVSIGTCPERWLFASYWGILPCDINVPGTMISTPQAWQPICWKLSVGATTRSFHRCLARLDISGATTQSFHRCCLARLEIIARRHAPSTGAAWPFPDWT